MFASIPARWRRPLVALLTLAFLGMLAVPHVGRIRNASLYSDDLIRVADLQEKPLSAVLFRPFNEHLAPWFEAVSWVAWQATGRDLTRTPIAFTLAGYVPYLIALGLLGIWILRETGSRTTTLVGCSVFATSSLISECAYWYSASSFTWALAWTLVAMVGATCIDGRKAWLARSCLFVGAFLAPASSAIGFLAGPLAVSSILARKRVRWMALIPMAGTAAFLAVAAFFRYDRVLGGGLSGPKDRIGGAILGLEAPIARLVPGTVAAIDLDRILPRNLLLALSLLAMVLVAIQAVRNRRIGLTAVSLGFILGGYLLTYPFRYNHLPRWLFATERFHLFPLVGLIVLIAAIARRWLSRFDGSALQSLAVADGVLALLLLIHSGRYEQQLTIYHHPEQQGTLSALVRVGELCERLGVTRRQCLASLDPVWSYWFQQDFNGLWLVPKFGDGPDRTDEDVRKLLLSQLTVAECQALWGGMDVSPHVRPIGAPVQTVSVGHLAAALHCKLSKGAHDLPTYIMTGWPATLEYRMVPEVAPELGSWGPRYLCLPTGPTKKPVEVLWRGEGEDWSRSRSFRFQPDPSQTAQDWAIPLDRLPHGPRAEIEGIRVRFVAAPIVFGEPRLVR